jgi:hypothetical protein
MTYFRYPHLSIHPSPYCCPEAPISMHPCVLQYWSCLMHPVQSDTNVTKTPCVMSSFCYMYVCSKSIDELQWPSVSDLQSPLNKLHISKSS